MVTATRLEERVETREIHIEELGRMMGIPIKLLPWWGSRRAGNVSGRGGVQRWQCPAAYTAAARRPEVRGKVICVFAGECHSKEHQKHRRRHRQTLEVIDAQGQAILIELKVYCASRWLLGVDEGTPYVVPVVLRVQSVNEAFDWLMPKKVKEAAAQGLDVKRQGDWFFIPHTREPNLNEWDDHLYYRLYIRNHLYRLFHLCYTGYETRHRASEVVYNCIFGMPCEVPVVRGRVTAPDHKTLRLEGWHLAIRNRSHQNRNQRFHNVRGIDD